MDQDRIVQVLWKKKRACAAELANQMDPPVSPREMLAKLETLCDDGIVRIIDDSDSDERIHEREQTVFALA